MLLTGNCLRDAKTRDAPTIFNFSAHSASLRENLHSLSSIGLGGSGKRLQEPDFLAQRRGARRERQTKKTAMKESARRICEI